MFLLDDRGMPGTAAPSPPISSVRHCPYASYFSQPKTLDTVAYLSLLLPRAGPEDVARLHPNIKNVSHT